MKKIYLLFSVLLFSFAAVHAQWKKTSFPTGEVFTIFATSGGNLLVSEYSYDVEMAGLYISTDAGETWSKTQLPDYRFTARSKDAGGNDIEATIYVTVGKGEDAKPEFTEVVR